MIAEIPSTVNTAVLRPLQIRPDSLPRYRQRPAPDEEEKIGSTVIVAIILNLVFVVGLKSPGK